MQNPGLLNMLLVISKQFLDVYCFSYWPGLGKTMVTQIKWILETKHKAAQNVHEQKWTTKSCPRRLCPQMVVYSLGMTLYWCVDYHLPQNQVRSAIFHLELVPFLASSGVLSITRRAVTCFPNSQSSWVLSWRVCCWVCARTRCWGAQTCWRCWRPASFTTRPPCCLLLSGWSGSW